MAALLPTRVSGISSSGSEGLDAMALAGRDGVRFGSSRASVVRYKLVGEQAVQDNHRLLRQLVEYKVVGEQAIEDSHRLVRELASNVGLWKSMARRLKSTRSSSHPKTET